MPSARPRKVERDFEQVESAAGVAVGRPRDELERRWLGGDCTVRRRLPVERALEHDADILGRERAQDVDARAGQERAVDLEGRVLGRRTDEAERAVFDEGQERVLLRLVEAVDLVEKQDRGARFRLTQRAAPAPPPRARP